jgi:hypothetical protein
MQKSTIAALDGVCTDLVYVATMVRQDTADVFKLVDPIEAVIHFDLVRKATEKIKTARKALEELEDSISREQIPTLFLNKQVKTLNIEGVGRATVSYRWAASIKDKDAGFKWLRDNGHGGIITETVNSSTLASFAKEVVQGGSELPDDIFTVGQNPYTSITRT